MHEDRTVLVEDTDIHGPGMQVDATVKLVLFRVESHEVSFSFVSERFPSASIPLGYAEGEASIIINAVEPTPYSLRFAPAFGRGSPPALGCPQDGSKEDEGMALSDYEIGRKML